MKILYKRHAYSLKAATLDPWPNGSPRYTTLARPAGLRRCSGSYDGYETPDDALSAARLIRSRDPDHPPITLLYDNPPYGLEVVRKEL